MKEALTPQGGHWKNKLFKPDVLLALCCYVFSLLSFVPVIKWIINETVAHDQLLFPIGILGLAGAYLFIERKRRIDLTLEFGKIPLTLLLSGYIALAIAILTKFGILMVPALCFILASMVYFLFGQRVGRLAGILLICFGFYVGVIIALPILDWFLRVLAGRNAGYLLEIFGSDASLYFKTFQGVPELVLEVDRRPFIVAAECNGFGAMSAAFILSLLLALYRKISLVDKILYIASALLVGFAFNIFRILIIIWLAPTVGRHYMLMHEIVGTIVFWLAMGIVIWLVPGKKAARRESQTALASQ